MKLVKILLFVSLLASGISFAEEKGDVLSADEIRALAKKPDDKSSMMEELKIYPDGKTADVNVTYYYSNGVETNTPTFRLTQKWVDGKYLVSSAKVDGKEGYVATTYNREKKKYVANILLIDGTTSCSYGELMEGKDNVLKWKGYMKGNRYEQIETIKGDEVKWITVTYMGSGNTVYYKEKGVAVVRKELSADEQNEIKRLIKQLGASRHSQREEAQKKLMEMKSKAASQLEEAAESQDPEIRERAKKILSNKRTSQTLPKHNGPFRVHVVQDDEDVFTIAMMYAVSVTSIRRANALPGNGDVHAGQKLIIPIIQE